ncbi:hypothetical protein ACIQU8_35755 [Streptomyces griseus]|uniref:hypothetical protein n=1 Tax=Streptomyces griseus TaxID=1911 RepID=UPI003800D83D
MDVDHEWPEALCLSRTHCENASEDTIGEFFQGAITLIDAGVAQPAFFLARQLAELSLKAFPGPGKKLGHDLDKLLSELQKSGDDLFAANDEQRLVVDFIRDPHAHDPKDDRSRYQTTISGEPSLASVCCADPELFGQYVRHLFVYAQGPISNAGHTL